MFFLDDDLCSRRVQDIKSMTAGRAEERGRSTRWVHDVEMLDGTRLVVLDVTKRQIDKTPVHVFPAEPGLMIWSPDAESDDDFLNPVVGWAITVIGSIVPVTAGGSINDAEINAVVIGPDGRVWQNGFVQASTLDHYKALMADGD